MAVAVFTLTLVGFRRISSRMALIPVRAGAIAAVAVGVVALGAAALVEAVKFFRALGAFVLSCVVSF